MYNIWQRLQRVRAFHVQAIWKRHKKTQQPHLSWTAKTPPMVWVLPSHRSSAPILGLIFPSSSRDKTNTTQLTQVPRATPDFASAKMPPAATHQVVPGVFNAWVRNFTAFFVIYSLGNSKESQFFFVDHGMFETRFFQAIFFLGKNLHIIIQLIFQPTFYRWMVIRFQEIPPTLNRARAGLDSWKIEVDVWLRVSHLWIIALFICSCISFPEKCHENLLKIHEIFHENPMKMTSKKNPGNVLHQFPFKKIHKIPFKKGRDQKYVPKPSPPFSIFCRSPGPHRRSSTMNQKAQDPDLRSMRHGNISWEYLGIPSRKLTYPTWGKGKSSSNMPYQGDMLYNPLEGISWRHFLATIASNRNHLEFELRSGHFFWLTLQASAWWMWMLHLRTKKHRNSVVLELSWLEMNRASTRGRSKFLYKHGK